MDFVRPIGLWWDPHAHLYEGKKWRRKRTKDSNNLERNISFSRVGFALILIHCPHVYCSKKMHLKVEKKCQTKAKWFKLISVYSRDEMLHFRFPSPYISMISSLHSLIISHGRSGGERPSFPLSSSLSSPTSLVFSTGIREPNEIELQEGTNIGGGELSGCWIGKQVHSAISKSRLARIMPFPRDLAWKLLVNYYE